MQKVIDYITQFLIRDEHNAHHVGYCNDKTQWTKYKVVIVPSNFFNDNTYGTPQSMPSLPLQEIEGIPFLYGYPKIEKAPASWASMAAEEPAPPPMTSTSAS